LVNNAGIGSYGEFRASDLERELGIIHVNCSALVQLTHLYLPGMVERRSGAILIVSSTAAYQGVPYMATYAATKGFDLLFAEALAREVEHYGVRVCALCPGPTASEFQKVAGVPDDLSRGLEPADRVAREGLRALAPENTRSSRDSRTGWEWKSSEWFPGGWSSQRPKCCSIPAANLGRRARNRTAAVRWTCCR
jgi:short-subunit dehydrogenase